VTFQAGDERPHAAPGDIVIIPPETAHKFSDDGPGQSVMVCIHASPEFITEWLD
jgi:quercetin dioxygenase-like cupin family protein